ncbi:hypothetical protein N7535_005117 [Penicillium sp. DV-2018c]|nr:hypothetical protein N7535_005117 [Penicillium sp. DV-2018c]
MIDPQDRFFSEGQGYFGARENPATETHCNVWDWDQLRLIKVKGTAKLFPPGEDVEPRFLRDLPIIFPQRVAFKFNPLGMPRRLQMSWKEMNLLSKLPPHPNLIPFDRIVLEDVESRVIGFTTKYIPGGTLADPKRPFRFEWLQQLTQLVDFLNLELGIMHQDIAPRNLLIDHETDKIVLFDFDWAANGREGLLDSRDDVSGVVFTLYEIITNDTHPTSIPHWDRNMDMVQNIE